MPGSSSGDTHALRFLHVEGSLIDPVESVPQCEKGQALARETTELEKHLSDNQRGHKRRRFAEEKSCREDDILLGNHYAPLVKWFVNILSIHNRALLQASGFVAVAGRGMLPSHFLLCHAWE